MPDGLYCFIVYSDYWKPERLFYAHVRALTVSHWMSGLKQLADLFGGYERNELDGYTNQIDFPRSGIFFIGYTRSPHGFAKLIGVSRSWEAQPRSHRPGDNLR